MPEILVFLLIKLILVIVIFALWMTMVPLLIWLERKVIADIQVRLGPNRVGPFGLLQPIADAIKLIMKEDITPALVDKWVYGLAPAMLMVPAFLAIAVIPIGGVVTIGERSFALQIMGLYRGPGLFVPELDAGILLVLALSSLGVYGVVLSGWSSANKYSLLGGMRSSAQMLSYELPLGVALVGPLLLAGTLRLNGVVEAQADYGIWFIVPQLVAFAIFLMSGTAEINRSPFDLPEAEQELIGGYHTEYSSFRFAMFFMAEYVNMVTISAVAATFFLGGYRLFFNDIVWLQPVWFVLKLMAFLYLFIWVRGTLPRVRYDQLMKLGWKVFLPVALGNLLVTGLVIAFSPANTILVMSIVGALLGIATFFGLSYAIVYGLRRRRPESERRVVEPTRAGVSE
ncbi:MAG: NADH-quinone oxidoreductase subunit NuoH [Armatimonadetes bacterium]|nr:NADH-quinone oxidoreductase subunit NuoH [Armatimonadota bacterium]